MAVTQYIGARYVPLFADPLEWNISSEYEPLTIVYNEGNSYTSRQYVPTGIELTDESYWALTGNYNAQIEQYRAEVSRFDERITSNTDAIAGKAPTNHASGETVYGVGNASNYGHVRLAKDDTPNTSGPNDGIAATPKTVSDAMGSIKTDVSDLQTDVSDLQTDISELQKSINANKTIESLYAIGDSYLDGYNPEGNVISYGNVIKDTLKINKYSQNALGGRKWDENTASLITESVNEYDNLLIALGHNNMTANALNVSQYVASTLNRLESIGYKGRVFLSSVLTTAKYMCLRCNEVDDSIVKGMQIAKYTFPCTFIANGWSWLIDSNDYGSADNGQHPKQQGQNIIAANIINGMYGGSTLNAAHNYGTSNGVSVFRIMQSVVVSILGVSGSAETIVYNPNLPFRFVETYFFVMQGSDGSFKNMSFKSNEGAKITYQDVTNAVYGSTVTSIDPNPPS